ncbi:hypothetical protein [Oceanithermus sp.]
MQGFWAAFTIGVVAGLLDAAPMVFQGQSRRAVLSAFLHWLALGLVIPYLHWGLTPWLTGAVAGLLLAVPVIVMVGEEEPEAWLPISLSSVLLGAAVG